MPDASPDAPVHLASGKVREIFALDPPLLATKTSRGCVYQCNFCTSNPWSRAGLAGKPYRKHSREFLDAHWGRLKAQFGITRLVVLDELVNADPAHFGAVLDEKE